MLRELREDELTSRESHLEVGRAIIGGDGVKAFQVEEKALAAGVYGKEGIFGKPGKRIDSK